MFTKIYDYMMLLLHSSVVGLHFVGFTEDHRMDITVFIGVSFMAISLIEALHFRYKLKEDTILHHNKGNKNGKARSNKRNGRYADKHKQRVS